MTRLRPFFSYYGSKWLLAQHYPSPLYPQIVEPFAVGAGYALRHHERRVLLIDRNPLVVAVWRYLIGASRAEILSLPAPVETVDDVPACQEARWLVGFWLGRACSSPRRRLSPWGRAGNWPSSFWGERVRGRIAEQVDHIRHWQVREGDYRDAADDGATWFVDPPYVVQGQHYPGPALDHAAVGQWARARRGQVIVCENAGATWLPFEPFRVARANSSRGNGRKSHEVVWTQVAA